MKDLKKRKYLEYVNEDQLVQVMMIGLALDLKEELYYSDDCFFWYEHEAQRKEYLIVLLPLFVNLRWRCRSVWL